MSNYLLKNAMLFADGRFRPVDISIADGRGFRLLKGILASTSSMIKSISFIFSCIIRFAFVI